ncbi:MAG: hypothetical protein Q4E69_04350 [Bacilli bacterium]|nr:hypothetical protein [Bacilli bacterium]
MAKYVFDFELVDATINVIKEKSVTMSTALNNYSSKLESSTSSWQSDTKNKFTSTDKSQVDLLKQSINDLDTLANYLNDVSKSIQSTEQALSSMKI